MHCQSWVAIPYEIVIIQLRNLFQKIVNNSKMRLTIIPIPKITIIPNNGCDIAVMVIIAVFFDFLRISSIIDDKTGFAENV